MGRTGTKQNTVVILTQLRGSLHEAPGLTAPLADDQVQHVGLQAVLEHLAQGRTQVLQDEVAHVGTHPAVPQLGLVAADRNVNDCREITVTGKNSIPELSLCV